jgi:pimeloyl-ACP methyl ester carboxylesterase
MIQSSLGRISQLQKRAVTLTRNGRAMNRIAVAIRVASLRAAWRLRTLRVQRAPERSVSVGGFSLAYDSFGPYGAPPILLIAGFGQQMIGWDDAFCALLAARGFHVIRFDNRDMGRSSRTHAAHVPEPGALAKAWTHLHPLRWLGDYAARQFYTLRDMADDAAGLLAGLGIDSAHIVGISMGGMIAQLLAIHHPARVRTLTSISSTTGDPRLPRPDQSVATQLLTPAPRDRRGFAKHAVALWRTLRATDDPVEDAFEYRRALRMHDRGLSAEGVRRQLMAIFQAGSRKDALARVKAPTLVIHGEQDPLITVEGGRATAEAVPGAKLLLLAGVGHALPASSWAVVIDAIAQHARSFESAPVGASEKPVLLASSLEQ